MKYINIFKFTYLLLLGPLMLVNLFSGVHFFNYSFGVTSDTNNFFIARVIDKYMVNDAVIYQPIREKMQGPETIVSDADEYEMYKLKNDRRILQTELLGRTLYINNFLGTFLLFLKSIRGLIIFYLLPILAIFVFEYHSVGEWAKSRILKNKKEGRKTPLF